METAWLLTALTLGFLGSMHCVGMCGPIAMALPSGCKPAPAKVLGKLMYNAGRLVTYAVMGMAAGLVGFTFVLAGFQRELSIVTGILIILGVLLGHRTPASGKATLLVSKFTNRLKRGFLKYFGSGSLLSSFMIGLLNGLLPCGLVYIALGGAIATGHYMQSAVYMMLFGLGTVPAMLLLGITGQLIGTRFSRFFRKASPVIAIVIALLLIYRSDTLSKKACHQPTVRSKESGKGISMAEPVTHPYRARYPDAAARLPAPPGDLR